MSWRDVKLTSTEPPKELLDFTARMVATGLTPLEAFELWVAIQDHMDELNAKAGT